MRAVLVALLLVPLAALAAPEAQAIACSPLVTLGPGTVPSSVSITDCYSHCPIVRKVSSEPDVYEVRPDCIDPPEP